MVKFDYDEIYWKLAKTSSNIKTTIFKYEWMDK